MAIKGVRSWGISIRMVFDWCLLIFNISIWVDLYKSLFLDRKRFIFMC